MKKKFVFKILIAILAILICIVFTLDTVGIIMKESTLWYIYVLAFVASALFFGAFFYDGMFYLLGSGIAFGFFISSIIIVTTPLTMKHLWPIVFINIAISLIASPLIIKKWRVYTVTGIALCAVSICSLIATLTGKYYYLIPISIGISAIIYCTTVIVKNFAAIKKIKSNNDYYVRPSKEKKENDIK